MERVITLANICFEDDDKITVNDNSDSFKVGNFR